MSTNTELVANDFRCNGVKFLAVVQGLLGFLYLGYAAYLYLVTTPEIYRQNHAIEAIHNLRMDTLATGIVGTVTLASALGLRKNKLWAYNLGGAVTWFIVAGSAISLFVEKPPDWEMLWILLPYLPLWILFLLPGTRKQLQAAARP